MAHTVPSLCLRLTWRFALPKTIHEARLEFGRANLQVSRRHKLGTVWAM